jgi:ribosomal protein L11 methylase PrmA
MTKPQGLTLLSGLLRNDEQMVLERFRAVGFAVKNICYRAEWLSILLLK